MADRTPGPWRIKEWSAEEAFVLATVNGKDVHVTMTAMLPDAEFIVEAEGRVSRLESLNANLLEALLCAYAHVKEIAEGNAHIYQEPRLLQMVKDDLKQIEQAISLGEGSQANRAAPVLGHADLLEALDRAVTQLRHLQMFPENSRNDSTNELIVILDHAISQAEKSNG